MALNKKRSVSASASASTETTSTSTETKASMDLAALQTALAKIVQLVADLSGKLEAANGRIDELENKLNAALEDDDDDDDDDDDEDEDEEVTEDDIDCNKAFEQYKSLEGDQQKKVLAKAMESSGIKSAKSKDIKTNAKLALAIADVMCDDEFGWDVEDFLKD